MPLHAVKEACTIRFKAIDGSKKDFIENSKSFLNSVEWVVTAVHTPTSDSSGKSSAASTSFQPWTATVRSSEGEVELAEVPFHQLYQFQARPPEGYIGSAPALFYRYIGSETFLEIKEFFRPCGDRPTRSAVFVQQQCPGIRWGSNSTVLVGGRPVLIRDNGIMDIPDDMRGVLPITSRKGDKSFSPAFLDLTEGANPVSTINVSDQAVTEAGVSVQAQFVDLANKPFAHRQVSVLLPSGDEIQVLTDEEGRFEAPVGSQVFAREDDLGSATEPVIVTAVPTK